MVKQGIDLSKWNGTINWDQAKKAGVEFAILREGYGKENPSQKDKMFEPNYQGCIANNIPVGVYHYSYADSVSDAKLEAQFCLKNIKGKNLLYPVVFDIEDKEMLKLSTRLRTDICKAFCDTIEDSGYYAMIYCNLNWLNSYLYKDELINRYDLWLAQWGTDKPSVSCGMWQYSDLGTIDGIKGNVDLNQSFMNYPELIKARGLNCQSNNDNTNSEPFFIVYTVQKGDTLWELAKKYLGNGSRYQEIKILNGLSNDTIYSGDKLKIPKN